jgi:predicted phage terminase large subunit-like protein
MHRPLDISSALNQVCRTDFQAFVERVFATLNPSATLERGTYLPVLCDHLARVESGDIKRLLITIPPRHLKTVTASIALPAWVLGRDPTKRILTVTYARDLTTDHSRDFLKIARSGWYAHVFPETAMNVDRDTVREYRTRHNGFRLGSSLGGTLTGLGGDLIIIDDLMKAADARSPGARERARHFYGNTLVSRLNNKSAGSIIAVQQRLHEEDLAAHLLGLGFEHLNLPAIAEERQEFRLSTGRVYIRNPGDLLKPESEPLEILGEIRAGMGGPDFEAQFQQNPTPPDSALIEWNRIQTYEEAPPRDRILHVVQSWDTALSDGPKSDYSVCTTWGFYNDSWLLLEVKQVRKLYADLLALVRRERKRWQTDTILVESAGVGIALLADLARDLRCQSEPEHHAPSCARQAIVPKMSKEDRLTVSVERLYSGKVKFPVTAAWLPALKREMTGFPHLAHDDQVDSVTQFVHWMMARNGRVVSERSDRPRPNPPRRR